MVEMFIISGPSACGSQRGHAVGAGIFWQVQAKLPAHVVRHEPASHKVVAPGEAAGAALGRSEGHQHVGLHCILRFVASLGVPACE